MLMDVLEAFPEDVIKINVQFSNLNQGLCTFSTFALLVPSSSAAPPRRLSVSRTMLHSIYDLTTFCRKTTGDVPAKLVVRISVCHTRDGTDDFTGRINHCCGIEDVSFREWPERSR